MSHGTDESLISCPLCGGRIIVIYSWDDGYNTKGTGIGLPPSADMDLIQETCECEQTEKWYLDVSAKFSEIRRKEKDRMAEYRSREDILMDEYSEQSYYKKHCIRNRGGDE